MIARTLRKLKNQPELSEDTIKKAVESLSLELVLTAHPTEITRRTLIHKMVEVNACLKQLDNKDIADYEHNQLMRRLRQLIAQSWHTDEIRKLRPSPVDEAKWGFAVVENSLWQGVPNYLRELNEQLEENLGYNCPSNLFRYVLPRGWAVTATATRTSLRRCRAAWRRSTSRIWCQAGPRMPQHRAQPHAGVAVHRALGRAYELWSHLVEMSETLTGRVADDLGFEPHRASCW